jgi:hypothetical protein
LEKYLNEKSVLEEKIGLEYGSVSIQSNSDKTAMLGAKDFAVLSEFLFYPSLRVSFHTPLKKNTCVETQTIGGFSVRASQPLLVNGISVLITASPSAIIHFRFYPEAMCRCSIHMDSIL